MKTAKDFLKEYVDESLNSLLSKSPAETIVLAMEEYGKQMYNQAVEDKWISIKDKRPDKNGYYIVSYKGFGGNYVVCVEYSSQFFKFKELNSEITHWQNLPSPPTL